MIVYIGVTCLTIKSLGVNGIILGNIIAFNISIIIWLIILKKNYKVNLLKRKKRNGKID